MPVIKRRIKARMMFGANKGLAAKNPVIPRKTTAVYQTTRPASIAKEAFGFFDPLYMTNQAEVKNRIEPMTFAMVNELGTLSMLPTGPCCIPQSKNQPEKRAVMVARII